MVKDFPPIHFSTGHKDNLRNLHMFGCLVWVYLPGIQTHCFKDNAYKGIFLSFSPHTLQKVLWYDVERQQSKIDVPCINDEGLNDIPAESLYLNTKHLLCIVNGADIKIDSSKTDINNLVFYIYYFIEKRIATVCISPMNKNHIFIFELATDNLYYRVYVNNVKAKILWV